MIKIFEIKNQSINFVDNKNNVIGLDLYQQCCEQCYVTVYNQHGEVVETFNDSMFEENDFLRMDKIEKVENYDLHTVIIETNNGFKIKFNNNHNGYYTHDVQLGKIQYTSWYHI